MLLFANVVIMAIDARESDKQRIVRVWAQTLASAFQNVSSKAGGATSSFFREILNFRSTAQENEDLKKRLAQTEVDLRVAREQAADNERLKGLLNLKEKTGYDSVPARVIARDPSVWFNTITIDRGTSSGVAINMPVVTAGGIVGRVITVGPWAAQVMLVTDEKAGAGAVVGQLGQYGALASVKGRPDIGPLEMRHVPALEKLAPADYVLTPGHAGLYPPPLNVPAVA